MMFSDQTYCLRDISKGIHLFGGIFYISHVLLLLELLYLLCC
jgi:hypothetical protein